MAEQDDELILTVIKISSMVIMFFMILVVGLYQQDLKPSRQIKYNIFYFYLKQKLLSFTAAFSGGLFLSFGLLHLLPEAQEQILQYYQDNNDTSEHFPIVYLVTILSFALILWIEKIATNAHYDHDHNNELSMVHLADNNQQINPEKLYIIDNEREDLTLLKQEQNFRESIQTSAMIAKRVSHNKEQINRQSSMTRRELNQLAPYILQIAIGIHAVFEGLAIGIEKDVSACLGISVAVVCHKWADGLTLGLAFRKAEIDVNMATIMIIIQAIMNPVGIGLGWILSSQGLLVTSIFESISAGTFIYIATVEVIVEEFNIARYKWQKFVFFMITVAFISSIWYLEKLTEKK